MALTKSTVCNTEGSYTVYEYDENSKIITKTPYDKDGNVIIF